MTLKSVPKRSCLGGLGRSASVRDVTSAMTRANCGSVLIIDDTGAMLGVLTERDLMTCVLAEDLDADATAVTVRCRHRP